MLPPHVLSPTCRAASMHGHIRPFAEANLVGHDAGKNRLARLRARDHERAHDDTPFYSPIGLTHQRPFVCSVHDIKFRKFSRFMLARHAGLSFDIPRRDRVGRIKGPQCSRLFW
jgi:hypothetical protein